jgi:hypothetical protein
LITLQNVCFFIKPKENNERCHDIIVEEGFV